MEAPTFINARRELYTQLSRYTFGKVVRCTVPPDGQTRVGDQVTVTYFHGLATKIEHRPLPVGSRPTKLWFKKAPADAQQRALIIGPLQLDAADDQFVPRPGDVIVGNVVPSDGGRRPPRELREGGVGAPESNDRFTFWHPHAACLEYLLNFLYNGTALPEAQLAHELRSRRKGGEDDVWAVARLILFGNVAAFAQQHLGTLAGAKPMRLSMPPLDFVWTCATKLDDDSIWAKFVELVPDAQPPAPPVEPEPVKAVPLIVPPLFGAGNEPPSRPSSFVGRARRGNAERAEPPPPLSYSPPPPPPPAFGSASYTHADAYSPDAPSYYPVHHSPQPYGSYTPQSPPHTPQHTPHYQYQQPQHPPTSSFFHTPPYHEPRSPLYSPSNSPPYCPTTPPGEFDEPPQVPYHAPPAVNADSVLKLLQRVSSIQSAQAPPPRSFSPPRA